MPTSQELTHANIRTWQLRAKCKQVIRKFFDDRGYLEIDTPVAVVCPGTEVHLQYFATEWQSLKGECFPLFLRSSPELHMKMALASGCKRLYQLAPCFRNAGEFSDWHQPEFTMLEWYQSGQSYNGLIDQTEELLRETADMMASFTGIKPADILPDRITRLGVYEAFKDLCQIDLVDQDPDLAQKCMERGILSVKPEDDFETAYFKTLIERIEPALASFGAAVLKDYPPSQAALAVVSNGVASRFEFYVGRVELCNGFFELTGGSQNRQRVAESFALRQALGLPPVPQDEEFYAAMDQIKEPCAGNALGFDRWLALLCGELNLNQAIPFRLSGPWAGPR